MELITPTLFGTRLRKVNPYVFRFTLNLNSSLECFKIKARVEKKVAKSHNGWHTRHFNA